MKQISIFLCVMGFSLQSCHIGLGQDSQKIQLLPERTQESEQSVLSAGTPVYLSCQRVPLMKDIRTAQTLIFKTSKAVLSKEGNILIAAGSTGIAKIVRIDAKGRTAADAVTVRLESVSASDGQTIALKSESVTLTVNLYDREALLFRKGFELSGVITADVLVQL